MEGFWNRLRASIRDRIFGRPAQRAKLRRPKNNWPIESMEERILPTATAAPTALSAAAQTTLSLVTDPGVHQLVQTDLSQHQSVTRSDLLAIFSEVEQDHVVSAGELTSLKTLVARGTSVAMPSPVVILASKVLNGDPANAYLKSAASPTGNLFAGVAASQMSALVNDWFLGINPVLPANPAVPMTFVNGMLFGKGGPKYTDVAQGALGDCTLLASVAEVAFRRPDLIQSMFINNGDGTVTVRLYHNRMPDYVTVNTQLPNGGQLYDRVTNGVLWAALLEKAIVQENESGWLGTWHPGSNSYSAIDGGDYATTVSYLGAITGLPTSYFGVGNPSTAVAAWQANKFVVLATWAGGNGLVADHAYAMIGYDLASDMPIALFNPWGIAFGQVSISSLTLTTKFQFGASAGSDFATKSRDAGEGVVSDRMTNSSSGLSKAITLIHGIDRPSVSPSPVPSLLPPSSDEVLRTEAAAIDAAFAQWPGDLLTVAA